MNNGYKVYASTDYVDEKVSNIDLSNYETKEDAKSKLNEAKEYTDSKSLPVVSTNDNGKFLRVVDGLWDAVVVPNAEEASF